MKYGSIVMAIVLFCGFCSTVQSQWVQTNGLRDQQIVHLPNMGANVSQGMSREFLGAPSKDRLHTGFVTGLDSLRVKDPSYPFPNDRFIPDGLQRGSNSALAKSSPQSQSSVIDTAIVRRLGYGVTDPGDTTRHVYSFNAKAKMTSDLTQKLIGGLWVDILRQTNTYDASNNMRADLYEYWSNSQWMNNERTTYTYDANGNMLSELYEYWWWNQWVNNERTTYTYDANGNRLSELYEQWSNGQLMYSYRYTYTYDANGNRLSELWEQWFSDQSVSISRYMNTYDANGDRLSRFYEQWSDDGKWVNDVRCTYTYDANGNMLSELYEYWDDQWVNSERTTYTYDANNHVLSELYEQGPQGQLVNLWRSTYTYDANGDRLSWLNEQWSNGQWVGQYRETSTCDAQGNLTSVWCYTWLDSAWTPTGIGKGLSREFLGRPSKDRGHAVFFVSDSAGNFYGLGSGYNFTLIRKLIVTGVASQSGSGPATYSLSQNYPNPFNPTTVISYQLPTAAIVRLVVYDLIGREVAVLVDEMKNAGTYEVRFDGSNLASGVYFYRIQAGDFTKARRLLLLK